MLVSFQPPVTTTEGHRPALALGTAVLDRSLRYLDVSQALADLNGLPVAEHIGRTVAEVTPDMAGMIEPLLRQVLETGHPVLDVELYSGADPTTGSRMACITSFYPIVARGGTVLGIDAVVHTLSAHTPGDPVPRGVASLPQSSALQHLLLRSEYADVAAGGFVYEWDLATAQVARTHGLSQLLGFQPQELAPTREAW